MDDATGQVLSLFLVEEEGTASSFRGLSETIQRHGLFSSLYSDRGSHYFYTPEAGGKIDEKRLTQVGRALRDLKIQHIPSYSPQGRGRIERLWDTLQNRLPPLLRAHGLTSIEAANTWLRDVYIPQHNARFGAKPAQEGTAFIPFVGDLANILCIEEERVVAADNCVRYRGLVLQIPESAHRHHFVKTNVRVLEYWNGPSPFSTAPGKLPSFMRMEAQTSRKSSPRNQSRKSASRRGLWTAWIKSGQEAPVLPTPPTGAAETAARTKSGHLECYLIRTSTEAIDIGGELNAGSEVKISILAFKGTQGACAKMSNSMQSSRKRGASGARRSDSTKRKHVQSPQMPKGHLEKYPFRAACESDSKNLFEFDHLERVRWGNWVSLI